MSPSLMVFALTALLLQAAPKKKEPTAEEFYRKVEERYANASTLRVKCEITFDAEGAKGKATVEASFDTGNRYAVAMKARIGEQNRNVTLGCDGTKMTTDAPMPGKPASEEAPDRASENLRRYLVRMGIMMPLNACISADDLRNTDRLLSAIEFAFRPDEKIGEQSVRVVEYGLVERGKRGAAVKVWIDPKTLEILKRELKGEGNRPIAITETYSGSKFGAEEGIPK